jgi:putative solute:sodium symporter small subunit
MPTPRPPHGYWQKTLRLTALLFVIWFAASFGVVYWVDDLDRYAFLGFPLGFFMAAQGSLLIYVLLMGCYARIMSRLDKRYGVDES